MKPRSIVTHVVAAILGAAIVFAAKCPPQPIPAGEPAPSPVPVSAKSEPQAPAKAPEPQPQPATHGSTGP